MGVTGIMAGIVAALPFTTPQYEVRVERDVVYAEARGTWASAPFRRQHTFQLASRVCTAKYLGDNERSYGMGLTHGISSIEIE